MGQVAAQARCSKATLYRRWGTKEALVADAVRAARPASVKDIDSGSLRGDLIVYVTESARDGERITGVIAALGHAVLHRPELGAVRSALVEPHTAHLQALVDRAVGRGEIPAAAVEALDLLPRAFLGVAATAPIFEGAYADADFLIRFVEGVLGR